MLKHSLIALTILTIFATLHAQPDTISLDDVTIAVTPFEQRLSETTGSLSILPTDRTEATHTINLSDQLNTAPGVFMSSGTHTTNRLTIRGIGSRTPYSTNRIRAYIEEIPLTNGDGVSAIEDMDLAGLSRMEILKGPASAMYGSGLGGVVKLRALYPTQNGPSMHLSSSAGSFNTWKNAVRLGWKQNHTAITAGYTRSSSDGYRENNSYTRDHLFLHGTTGSHKNRITFHLLTTRLDAQIPSSLNETTFLENPESAAANWLAIEGFKAYTKITGGASWQHTFSENWHNKLVVFSAWSDPYESRPFNILDEGATTGGLRNYLRYEKNNLRLQAGFELFHEAFNWKIIETLSGEEGDLQLHNSETRRYGNLFTHARWSPANKLNIEGGLNLNLLEYRLNTLFHIDDTDQSGSYSYDPVLSPRLGLNYNVTREHFIHATAGHGFSAPSLEETLLPGGLVNPDLKPETGWNLDAGLRGWSAGKRWYYDITAYTIRIRNMLVTKRVTEEIFSGINAGSARLSGIEIFNRIDLSNAAAPWENTLYTSIYLNSNRFTEFVDDGNDFSGNALPGIPAQMVHARFQTAWHQTFDMMAELRYSGKQLLNDANTAAYDGHLTANVRVSYNLKLRARTGKGAGIGNRTGVGNGNVTGTEVGTGIGTGSGTGSGAGTGIGSGAGTGIGSGTGTGIGSGTGTAAGTSTRSAGSNPPMAQSAASMSQSAAPGNTPSLRITAGINNLFDTRYASMILVNAPSFGSNAPRYYYPGAPRNYFISLGIDL
jgi:iron complex outermembrane recepter protein